jgi:filamentous hemagglutinin
MGNYFQNNPGVAVVGAGVLVIGGAAIIAPALGAYAAGALALGSVASGDMPLGVARNYVASTAARADELRNLIPSAQQGRITMGVGLAEDANGARQVLIGTSEPRGYLRPGVTLNQGETLVSGTGHAEADIVNHANQNGLTLLEVGATRPICPACAELIKDSGAQPVTPLKVP